MHTHRLISKRKVIHIWHYIFGLKKSHPASNQRFEGPKPENLVLTVEDQCELISYKGRRDGTFFRECAPKFLILDLVMETS